MPPKKMLAVLFLQYGISWATLTLLGVGVFVVLGFAVNLKFFILALIWIFLFIPLIIAFLYFFYGMKPLTAFNSIPHICFFSDNEIKVRLSEIEHEDIPEINKSKKDFSISLDSYKEMKTGPDYVLLFFHKDGWLWLPVTAFESVDSFKNTINIFKNGG